MKAACSITAGPRNSFNIFSASSSTKLLAGLCFLVVMLRVVLMKEALSAASQVATINTTVDIQMQTKFVRQSSHLAQAAPQSPTITTLSTLFFCNIFFLLLILLLMYFTARMSKSLV